jgi:hypothetical protein
MMAAGIAGLGIADRDLKDERRRSAALLRRPLARLVSGWPQSRIDELMPWHWGAAKSG